MSLTSYNDLIDFINRAGEKIDADPGKPNGKYDAVFDVAHDLKQALDEENIFLDTLSDEKCTEEIPPDLQCLSDAMQTEYERAAFKLKKFPKS